MQKKDKIKVLIVDDEEPARKLILNFLKENNNFEIIGQCADGFSAVKQINELKPDLVFLDIQMPKLTGLEVIDLIENNPFIIFITAYDEFAVKAFELNAIDYLMKPYSKKRFSESLQKIEDKIYNQSKINENYQNFKNIANKDKTLDRIAVKVRSKIEVIPIEQISVFEAQDDYVEIHSEKGKFLKNLTMKYLEEHLDKNIFQRIHRSFIVNINCIEKIEKAEKDKFHIIMKNNNIAKASKSGMKILKEKLNL